MKRLTFAFMAACASAGAMAQQAGDNVVSVGWFHIMPQDSSNGLTTRVINAPINDPLRTPDSFTSPGSGLSVNNADTLGLTFTHFLTDNIAVTAIGGVPPEFKLTGRGTIRAPGPAGALGHVDMDDPTLEPAVRTSRQWSPGLILQYYFGQATSRFRPFVGAGIVYSFFTNIELNQNFVGAVNRELGSVLAAGAGKPGPTSVEADSSSSFAPIFNLGASYALDKRWSLTATVSYMPLKTEAATIIKAADGTTLATTKTTLKANPIVTFLAVSYKF